VSSLVRRINDRIRIAPAQLFLETDCNWLVLIDDSLLCLATGRQSRLQGPFADLADDAFLAGLVQGAQDLSKDDGRPVGLLLPHSQFLYSHYSVQLGDEHLGNRELVLSAIALQKDLLLPAMDEEFALAAGSGQAAGVAFWLPRDTLQKVEDAFAAADIELVAILPRALAAAPATAAAASYVVADEDASSCSLVKIDDRVATRMLSAFKQEFDNDELESAWNEQAAPLLEEAPVRMQGADDWRRLGGVKRPLTDYVFYTQAFLQQVENKNQLRKVWAAGALAVAAVLVLALPLVYQWVDAFRLESARNAARQEARVAATFQNRILGMESEWGVIYEYPEGDAAAILTTLNSMIRNSLTSFSLEKSTVEIQGFTSDPEQLTKLLVAQPMFEKIEQTRSISGTNSGSGDRFGLRMTLAGPGHEQYSKKYSFK
jgi:hypothetical protein